jgi:transposase-like protein
MGATTKPKRRYTEDDKASALALLQANGGALKATARELDIPLTTLRAWRDGVKGVGAGVAKKCPGKKADLRSLFERVARKYLRRALSAEAVEKTAGKDAVIAAATATDKHRLLGGESTDNVAVKIYVQSSDFDPDAC